MSGLNLSPPSSLFAYPRLGVAAAAQPKRRAPRARQGHGRILSEAFRMSSARANRFNHYKKIMSSSDDENDFRPVSKGKRVTIVDAEATELDSLLPDPVDGMSSLVVSKLWPFFSDSCILVYRRRRQY